MEEPNTNNSGEHEAPAAPAEAPKEAPAAPAEAPKEAPAAPVEASSEATTAPNPAPASAPAALAEAPKMNFFGALINALKKPISTLEDDAEKFKAPKNAIILTLISAGILTVASLIMSIIETVHSSSCSLFGGGCKSVWYWNNLKNFDWLGSTLWRFLGVVIAMLAVAAVFFGFSRLFKQMKSNYCRMLSAIAISEFPLAIGLLLYTLVGLLSPGVALAVLCVCATYAGVMFYEGVNLDADLHGDKKFYFNALSIISLVILSYSGFQIYLNMSLGGSLKGATMELQDTLNEFQDLFDY